MNVINIISAPFKGDMNNTPSHLLKYQCAPRCPQTHPTLKPLTLRDNKIKAVKRRVLAILLTRNREIIAPMSPALVFRLSFHQQKI